MLTLMGFGTAGLISSYKQHPCLAIMPAIMPYISVKLIDAAFGEKPQMELRSDHIFVLAIGGLCCL